MKTRENGFYYVKTEEGLTVAAWKGNHWETVGNEEYYNDEDWEEILGKIAPLQFAQFSQQPTEKTREGAITELMRYASDKPIQHRIKLTEIEEFVDALIQSGYIQGKGLNLEPYPQTENTNTPTLQSDSVDAEQAWKLNKHELEFRSDIYGERVSRDSANAFIRYAFLAGLSSKVKPINEDIVRASKKLLQQFIVDSDDRTGRFNKGKVNENELFEIIAELESALNPPTV